MIRNLFLLILLISMIATVSFAFEFKSGTVSGSVKSFDEKEVVLLSEGKTYKMPRKHFANQKLKVGEKIKIEILISDLTSGPKK